MKKGYRKPNYMKVKKQETEIRYGSSGLEKARELVNMMGKDAFIAWQQADFRNGYAERIAQKLDELKAAKVEEVG